MYTFTLKDLPKDVLNSNLQTPLFLSDIEVLANKEFSQKSISLTNGSGHPTCSETVLMELLTAIETRYKHRKINGEIFVLDGLNSADKIMEFFAEMELLIMARKELLLEEECNSFLTLHNKYPEVTMVTVVVPQYNQFVDKIILVDENLKVQDTITEISNVGKDVGVNLLLTNL